MTRFTASTAQFRHSTRSDLVSALSTPHRLDRFRDGSSCSLPRLVGFDLVDADDGGRLPAMGDTGRLTVAQADPTGDTGLGPRPGFTGAKVDAFMLHGPPKALEDGVAEAATLAVHRDPGADPVQSVGPGERGKLRTLTSHGRSNRWRDHAPYS
ncbi:MAG: hypothetical protein WAS26_00680 [Paracoccaceae bacterium]